MFPALRLEVTDRFTAVDRFFGRLSRSQGELSQTARGLVFVQLYAIHEYTVVNVVRQATDAVVAHGHKYKNLRPSLLAMFLDPQWRSFQDSPPIKRWDRRLALLDQASSKTRLTNPGGAAFPVDGTHFRHTHVELILKVFGVNRALTARRLHLNRIDEVVNNRNRIAHGVMPISLLELSERQIVI